MTVRQLECFLAMAEELHYTKAADLLHISQPSLSYSISEMEKELGFQLFVRKNNHTVLSDQGAELLPYAQAVAAKLAEMTNKAKELANPMIGTVRLGNLYSISFDIIPQLLETFYKEKEHCYTSVNVVQGVSKLLMDQLINRELDLAIAGDMGSKQVEGVKLFTQELMFIAPLNHPLAGKKEVSLEEIKNEPLISLGSKSNISTHIAKCFEKRGLHANFSLEVAECSAMGAFISSNMCCAVAPIVPSLKSNNVSIIPFTEEDRLLMNRDMYLWWAKDRQISPAVKRLKRFIIRFFREDPE